MSASSASKAGESAPLESSPADAPPTAIPVRSGASAEWVNYELSLRTAEEHWTGSVRFEGAAPRFNLSFAPSAQGTNPPEWCLNILQATLRGIARDAMARGEYPRRIARWRPQPSAGQQGEGA